MQTLSIFDVIGPNMIGPSSSHTAGAASIGLMAGKLFPYPVKKAEFRLYGSFAETYRGHGTDRALLGGVLGFAPSDKRIRHAMKEAEKAGITYTFTIDAETKTSHPNTADITLDDGEGHVQEVRGESVGGGRIRIVRIDGVDVNFTGQYSTLIVRHIDKPGIVAYISTMLAVRGINIAFMRVFREESGPQAYTVVESDEHMPEDLRMTIGTHPDVRKVMLVQTKSPSPEGTASDSAVAGSSDPGEFDDFDTAAELLKICRSRQIPISEVMRRREIGLELHTEKETKKRLRRVLEIMDASAHATIERPVRSLGGLLHGEAKKLSENRMLAGQLGGEPLTSAMAYAMAVIECSSSMGLIVAAPTAGSSGVLPGIFMQLKEQMALTEEDLEKGILNTAAIGYLAMRNASVSGAEAGCQAEVGIASAMAASAAVEIAGGSPEMCLEAASFAISGLLGLVCDPVAGYVESPCQSRNAVGAANAYTAAQLAISGIRHINPLDDMLEAMLSVGRAMPRELRETARGGNAATRTACTFCGKHR